MAAAPADVATRPSVYRRVAAPVRDPFFALYVLGAFWGYTAALGAADFGQGLLRVGLILLGVAGLALFGRVDRRGGMAVGVTLLVAVAALVGLRSSQLYAAVAEERVPTIDIGTTTITAVEMVSRGENPYEAPIDFGGSRVDPEGRGLRFFGGYKYGPGMIWAYYPFVTAFGASGVFIVNLIALLAAAAAAAAWASMDGGVAAGAGAAATVLIIDFIHVELFVGGVTDMVPVALGLAGFALRARGWATGAGIALGFSFANKPLPALLYAIPMLFAGRRRVRFGLAAVGVAVVAYLPFLLDSPEEVVAGLIVFNLVRPPDSTSLLDHLPDQLVPIVSWLSLWLAPVIALLWGLDAKDRRAAATAGISSAVIAVFFVGSKLVHRNYLLWLLPVVAVAVAARIWSDPRNGTGHPAPTSAQPEAG